MDSAKSTENLLADWLSADEGKSVIVRALSVTGSDTLRRVALEAAHAAVDLAVASDRAALLFSKFESVLDKAPSWPNQAKAGAVISGVLTIAGRVAGHLDKAALLRLVVRCGALFPGESHEQSSAAALATGVAMRAAIAKGTLDGSAEPTALLTASLASMAGASTAAESRTAACGIGAACGALGEASLLQHGVVPQLTACMATANKAAPHAREAATLAVAQLCLSLKYKFEPYSIPMLPQLVKDFVNKDMKVAAAAVLAARALLGNLSTLSVKAVLGALYEGMQVVGGGGRTKIECLSLASTLAIRAPRTMGPCLPECIPLVMECLNDSNAKVQGAAEAALPKLCSCVDNPEVAATLKEWLMTALRKPDTTLACIDEVLMTTFCNPMDGTSLAFMMPVVIRGIKDANYELVKKATVCTSNLCALIKDSSDIAPFVPSLLPLLEKNCEHSSPDVRTAAETAKAKLLEGAGDLVDPQLRLKALAAVVRDGVSASHPGVPAPLLDYLGDTSAAMLEEKLGGVVRVEYFRDAVGMCADWLAFHLAGLGLEEEAAAGGAAVAAKEAKKPKKEKSAKELAAEREKADTDLLRACKNDEGRKAESALAKGADPAVENDNGNSALHIAAGFGALSVIRVLHKAGAKLDAENKKKLTPLQMARDIGEEEARDIGEEEAADLLEALLAGKSGDAIGGGAGSDEAAPEASENLVAVATMAVEKFKDLLSAEAKAILAESGDKDFALDIQNIILAFAGRVLLRKADIRFERGHRYGLVGQNGTGKTTLLNRLAAKDINGFPQELRTWYIRHEVVCDDGIDVRSFVQAQAPDSEPEAIEAVLREIGFDEKVAQTDVNSLSGGFKMKLSVALSILHKPELLLLDEPTNHLDRDSIDWLTAHLLALDGVTIAVVSHDYDFIDAICTDITHYDNNGELGKPCHFVYYPTNFKGFQVLKPEVAAGLPRVTHGVATAEGVVAENASSKASSKASSHTGSLAGSMDKLSLTRSESMASMESEGGPAADNSTMAKIDEMIAAGLVLPMRFPDPGKPDGIRTYRKPIMTLADCSFQYPGTDKYVLTKVGASLTLGSRAVIVGGNGSGKSTFLQLLIGDLEPEEGTGKAWRHHNLRQAYVAQQSLHHLEDFVQETPIAYIQQRFRQGLDAELSKLKTVAITEEDEALMKDLGAVNGVVGRNVKGKQLWYEVTKTGRGGTTDEKTQTYPFSDIEIMFKPYVKKLIKNFDQRQQAIESGMAIRPITAAEILAHLNDFGIDSQLAHGKIRQMSGGQRQRLVICAAFWSKPHVIALDEPTNYLDNDSVAALTKALKDFKGAVVTVSENEAFVAEISNEKWVVQDGGVTCVQLRDAKAR